MRWIFLLPFLLTPRPAAAFRFGEQKITVPDGYTVELAAVPRNRRAPGRGEF